MFKIIIKRIKRFFFRLKNNDPLFNCEYHKQCGCVHVDGPLCDFPNCDIRLEHIEKDFVFCPDCIEYDDCISGHFGLGCYKGKKLNYQIKSNNYETLDSKG